MVDAGRFWSRETSEKAWHGRPGHPNPSRSGDWNRQDLVPWCCGCGRYPGPRISEPLGVMKRDPAADYPWPFRLHHYVRKASLVPAAWDGCAAVVAGFQHQGIQKIPQPVLFPLPSIYIRHGCCIGGHLHHIVQGSVFQSQGRTLYGPRWRRPWGGSWSWFFPYRILPVSHR